MLRTHVIGAGVAGLAAAVCLAKRGHAVSLYEGSGHAGGRCRSFVDRRLECTIDNGNHLLLSGNRSALRYLSDIDSEDKLVGPEHAVFPFFEVRTGRRWSLRPGAGRIPWWIFDPQRRVPDTIARDYLAAARLATAGADRTVVECVGERSVLFQRLWEPLAVAALNTPAQSGAASLLWTVLRETFAKGEAACRPLVARSGLSDTFVNPALEFLRRQGAAIRFHHRLRQIEYVDARVGRLDFGTSLVDVPDTEHVVLALPPAAVARNVPSLTVPENSHPIVNVHFRLTDRPDSFEDVPIVGLIGGTAHWLFLRDHIASVTVSAADALAERTAEEIAHMTWPDVAAALQYSRNAPPTFSVVKEKRATFAQTPDGVLRRPGVRTRFRNLFLAGDWINTGIPATIESAVRSGYMAASALHNHGMNARNQPVHD